MTVVLRDRSLFECIGLSLQLGVRHFGALFLGAFLAMQPGVWLSGVIVADLPGVLEFAIENGFVRAVYAAFGLLVVVLALLVTSDELAGKAAAPPWRATALPGVGRRWPTVVALLCIEGLIAGAFYTVLVSGSLFLLSTFGGGLISAHLFGLLIEIYVFSRIYVAIGAALFEDIGALAALRRSLSLTRNHQGLAFGVAFFVHVITVGVGYLGPALQGPAELWGANAAVWIGQLLYATVIAIAAPATAVLYFTLRVREEGLDVERLAEIVGRIGGTGRDARAEEPHD